MQGDSDTLTTRDEISLTNRVVSFIVEEVLAHPPSGTAQVKESDWIDVMSIADLCIESCFRSDSLHQRLTSSSVELTDLYEIRTLPDADQTDVDLDAYNTYRRQSTLPNAIPITHRDRSAEEATAVTKASILQKKPELKAIDQEMRDELGFGIESIVNILNVAIEWDATKESPAVLGSTPSILDRCVQLAGEGCRSEAAAALEWMLLRGSDLSGDVIPLWETERREKRLATSPFVVVPEGVYVLPWTAESSLRILATYLEMVVCLAEPDSSINDSEGSGAISSKSKSSA